MSLPSDVTINNLKDFYQAILPYLNVGNGGTSDTPLGQVAFFDDVVAPAGWLIADGTVYNISDYPDLANQYERVHGSKNFYGGNGTTTFAVPDWDAIPAEVFGNSNIICVKAVPSSEMNTYSTTERRVATWVDGKPLYQKTFTGTSPSNEGEVATNLTNIDMVFVKEAIIAGSSGYTMNIAYQDNYVDVKSDGTMIYFSYNPGSNVFKSRPYNITLCYTKTTD